ncbi:isoleucine--tRNA ligase [Synergistaceae bacterium OttesenSCG-928-I11]|nr:isoleucine--tRNA ligase [Synergistaceae bacterium OttesenSCG-928-I11]
MSADQSKKSSNDYKNTLFLPQTDFPMRANLAKREPGFLDFWAEKQVYSKLVAGRHDRPAFVLHDGPPYANANIHIGHALNKILKDIIVRYKWERGYFAPYIPGFDTHGMPIEHKVLKDAGITVDTINPVELRKKCEEHARKYVKVQTDEFIRLGVMGNWEKPYITLTSDYEAAQMELFAEMVENDLVYRGRKSIFWCIDCETALAAAEIEYEDETSPSIYVSYPFPEAAEKFSHLKDMDVNVIIWTTTPWTLPASLAIAIHPEFDYSFYEANGKVYMIASAMKEEVERVTGLTFGSEIMRVKGKALECMKAIHPFYDRRIIVVLADYVTLDSGTGCVHTAPGHGVEDFETGVRYGLDIYNPVDPKGYFYKDTELVGALSLEEAEKVIFKTLTENGRLMGKVKLTHSYPHCWRCKKPVIFRATDQWFVSVSKFRDRAMACIDNEVEWIPAWGKDRISNMVRDRSDWCISRQRIWGVPIPAFYCKDCGQVILTADRIRSVAKKVKDKGSNYWWEATPEELLGDDNLAICPACGSHNIEKEKDIMDVWFDSGCSHKAVLENSEKWPELHAPCELYLEGSDQHRGWFQSSLLTSVATRDRAPYKRVLTHGFTIDEKGRKMSKSMGNAISPQEVVEKYGADILRMWVASTDYRGDVSISQTIIANLSESYRRIRNTARFLLANLSGFDPARDVVPHEKLTQIDQYVLLKLARLVERNTTSFDEYEFHLPMSKIHQFCDNELSSFYIDISKDKLYADRADAHERRCARSVMWEVLNTLVRMIAPVLSFTAEEIWQEMRKMDASRPESVHYAAWPEPDASGLDDAVLARWDKVLEARGAVSRALEIARSQGIIGHALDASVWMMPGEHYEDLGTHLTGADWETISIVSKFAVVDAEQSADIVHTDETTGIVVGVSKNPDPKCPRCWKHRPEVAPEGEHEVCDRCAEVLRTLPKPE